MKNQLLAFVLGVFIALSIAAGTIAADYVTFKPARPIHTVAYCGEDPHVFVVKYAAQGYVVTSSASQSYHNTFVSMSKY